MTSAPVAEIKRMAVHDGPGLRTTLFLKGCPLHCLWCHNPECISGAPQLLFRAPRCAVCGRCAAVCPTGAHRIESGRHIFRRELCTACGRCETRCPAGALTLCGRAMSAAEAAAAILEDLDFYRVSGGGATLSGGEPLLHPEFCVETLALVRGEGVHCAVDTSGAVSWSAFEKVLPVTDLFLYDFKQADSRRHRFCTGMGNEVILENLRKIDEVGKPVEIRIPLVPEHNDDPVSLDAAGTFLASLGCVTQVRLLAYHALARRKYAAAGMADTMPDVPPPSPQQLLAAADRLRGFGLRVTY